jgi:DNA-binding beta-propeller fold protein YncE
VSNDETSEIAVSPKHHKVFAPYYDGSSLVVVDTTTNAQVADVVLSNCQNDAGYTLCWPLAAAVDDQRDRVYVVREGDQSLSIFDANTYQEVGVVPLYPSGGSPAPYGGAYGIAIDTQNNVIYVADLYLGGIEVVDANTSRYLGTVLLNAPTLDPQGPLLQPYQLSFDSATGLLYAAADQAGQVVVLQTHPCGN